MQAMILAAGFGTRLQPYSLVRPKPLFPVLNRPLLLATIERLQAAGCRRIVVNRHHLGEQIAAAVAGLDGVELQHEPAILGTGGSLAEAAGRLADEPLLVSNGDIYHTIDFRQLYEEHVRQDHLVTMALHDCPRFNTVQTRGDRVTGFGTATATGTPGALAFTGVQVIDPRILVTMDERRPLCIIEHYRSLIGAGTAINCHVFSDPQWTDIGTVEEYLRLHGDLLTGRTPLWPELVHPPGDGVLIDAAAELHPACRIEPWACIGAARIETGTVIARTVIWDGAVVTDDRPLIDRLVAPPSLGTPHDVTGRSANTTLRGEIGRLLIDSGLIERAANGDREVTLQPLHGDGSSRRFFRVFCGARPLCLAVLPAGNSERELAESRSAATLADHLDQAGVPVPRLLGVDEQRTVLLFEDLGDCRLHDLLLRDRSAALAWYPEVVRHLARMQVRGAAGFRADWCFDAPVYDEQVMIERESLYFATAFWRDTLFGDEVTGLREEFAELARRAAADFELLFLHRDFQSRNIMINDGRVRIIDFQAGRLGPPGYDVASLLIDPYAALSGTLQDELLECYLAEMRQLGGVDVDKISASYPLLAVQRNLQIIGAFAYLSGRRKKPFFRRYIMPSLIMLQNRLTEKMFEDFVLLRRTVSAAISGYRQSIRG